MHQYARQNRFQYQVEQDYDDDFVYELAPLLTPDKWLSPVQVIVRDDKTYDLYFGVLYETLQNDVVDLRGKTIQVRAYAGVRIWEQTITSTNSLRSTGYSEDVVLYQLISQNGGYEIHWAEDFHTAYCEAADFLEMPIRAEGRVYVPKEIPTAWYILNGEQVRHNSGSPRDYSEVESGSDRGADDGDGLLVERLKYRVDGE